MIKCIHLKEVDSTQKYIKRKIEKDNNQENFCVYADKQIKGYGRTGSWESSKGGLFYSYYLQKKRKNLGIIIILAVKKTLNKYISNHYIKLPNDIYIENKKISGVLAEEFLDGYIIGIGINVNNNPKQQAVSMKNLTKETYNIKKLISELTMELEYFLNLEKKELAVLWNDELNILNKQVKFLDCKTKEEKCGTVNNIYLDMLQIDEDEYSFEQIRIFR